MRFVLIILLIIWATASIALESRYELKDDTLIFDMTIEKPGYKFTRQLELYDEMWIRWHLEEYPEIKTLKLTGPGGFMPAARAIADLLVKYEVDTIAYGECISACTTVFLGGTHRCIEEGAILGFHKLRIDQEGHKFVYDTQKEKMGWKDEFEYFNATYDRLVTNVVADMQFMESRGLPMEFIFKVFSTPNVELWIPSREELSKAGVVTK